MVKKVAEVQREIAGLREETDEFLLELERRARDALDWRAQVRRHPVLAVVAGLAVAGSLTLAAYTAYGRVRTK